MELRERCDEGISKIKSWLYIIVVVVVVIDINTERVPACCTYRGEGIHECCAFSSLGVCASGPLSTANPALLHLHYRRTDFSLSFCLVFLQL